MSKRTVKMVRDGITRNFSERDIIVLKPETEGWVRVEATAEVANIQQPKAEAAPQPKAEPAEAKPEPKAEPAAEAANNDAPFSIEGKTSKDFSTKDIANIKAALVGKSAEEIGAFFANEDRSTMLMAKPENI